MTQPAGVSILDSLTISSAVSTILYPCFSNRRMSLVFPRAVSVATIVIPGVVIGGLSSYFYIQDRRTGRSTSAASIAPTLLDGGAGVVFTVGGLP